MTIQKTIAIIGAGPAGLIAAEHLAQAGHTVAVYDRMPSPGRKFLFAGRGGLNLTHSEPREAFRARYGAAAPALAAALDAFPPEALRTWAEGLGEPTFVGTSGRVFPKSFKATPLLRAWLRRLDGMGVAFRFRHRWTGWAGTALTFETPEGALSLSPDATMLAFGGASWPRLGSDGSGYAPLTAAGVALAPLHPANAGCSLVWSPRFLEASEGAALKGCAFSVGGLTTRAEAVITRHGLEGGAVYALSSPLRAALAEGPARLTLDLKPDVSEAALSVRLGGMKKGDTLSNLLRKTAKLSPAAIGLMREAAGKALPTDSNALAALVKALPLKVTGLQPMDKAISTAGGVTFDEIDAGYMLAKRPGVFVAGEMLDWDAPTGGYLLQACFATGVAAAKGIEGFLKK